MIKVSQFKKAVELIKNEILEDCEFTEVDAVTDDLVDDLQYALVQENIKITKEEIRIAYNLAAHSAIEVMVLCEMEHEKDEDKMKERIAGFLKMRARIV